MTRTYAQMLATFCICIAAAQAVDQTWKNVTYLGGAPGVRVNRLEANQVLVLAPSKLTLRTIIPASQDRYGRLVKSREKVLLEIQRESLRAVTYQGFRHERRALQALVPIPADWPLTTDHLIIIGYRLPDGREPELLLRVDKERYHEIVSALQKMIAP